MSKFAIDPNKLPDAATEERAALDRETAYIEFNNDCADAPVASKEPLPPAMFVPDPRYPHGDIDQFEAHLAELKATQARMAKVEAPAPSAAPDKTAAKPAADPFGAAAHPLIASLLISLPPPDAVWSVQDRTDWLRAAESIFHLVYRADDQVTIGPKAA